MASGGIPIAYEHRSHISQKRGQFRYFDQQLGFPDWSRLTILDFGGNVGTFLDDAGSRIDPKHYWCLDITAEAIEFGWRRSRGRGLPRACPQRLMVCARERRRSLRRRRSSPDATGRSGKVL